MGWKGQATAASQAEGTYCVSLGAGQTPRGFPWDDDQQLSLQPPIPLFLPLACYSHTAATSLAVLDPYHD